MIEKTDKGVLGIKNANFLVLYPDILTNQDCNCYFEDGLIVVKGRYGTSFAGVVSNGIVTIWYKIIDNCL